MRALGLSVILVLLATAATEAGCGIFGCALQDLGNLTGITELNRAGETLDEAHDAFKNKVTGYGNLEEGISKMARDLADDICAAPYQVMMSYVAFDCSNWDDRLEGQHQIDTMMDMVIGAGLARREEFNGIQVRWCPLPMGAEGMAPDRGRIYLDDSEKGANLWDLGALLVHELQHIRQYRAQGTDDFKCEYSLEFVNCAGCQDGNHPHEADAYAAQIHARQTLLAMYGGGPPPDPKPQSRFAMRGGVVGVPGLPVDDFSSSCVTPRGTCQFPNFNQIGTPCGCTTPSGQVAVGTFQ